MLVAFWILLFLLFGVSVWASKGVFRVVFTAFLLAWFLAPPSTVLVGLIAVSLSLLTRYALR